MDVADVAWGKFFDQRKKTLWEKFPGSYRSRVVEVNDPLAMNRIRFMCPDMHDTDLKADECPWANPAHDLGGKKSGKCAVPCIGDWVWVTFEKQHPFAPLWSGAAVPLKRKYYALPFVAEVPELPPNSPEVDYKDYDPDYLPKDGRPLTYGHQDRYGNIDISSAIGFYPVEHDIPPPPPDIDPVNKNVVGSTLAKPLVNDPDKKFMLRMTKYGNMMIMGDQGYYWQKDDKKDDGKYGEFYGDATKDDKFEAARWLYTQKLINENHPKTTEDGSDQRRIELLTRYGHKIECRDVGWAQDGPIESKTRDKEYGEPTILSKEKTNDFRWIKIRTKGGMLFQAYDKGFDPSNDKFVTRPLLEETGASTEEEDIYWADRDARWIRIVSRHGYKLVIDDRGSDPSKSDELEQPSGNGILIKGRKTPSAHNESVIDNPRGFYWEFNENEELNHSSWGSPNGQSMEINDRYQYTMIASGLGSEWSSEYKGLKENEFIGKPIMTMDPEKNSHHMKIDLDNEYIRFKTRSNNGAGGINPKETSGVAAESINQGFEARDGASGDGPWVELVDSDNRGVWFSKKQGAIFRGSGDMFIAITDGSENGGNKILIHNPGGSVELYAKSSLNVFSDGDINFFAGQSIRFKATTSIDMHAGSSLVNIREELRANKKWQENGATSFNEIAHSQAPSKLYPTDRAKTYNGTFEAPDRKVIEHPIS